MAAVSSSCCDNYSTIPQLLFVLCPALFQQGDCWWRGVAAVSSSCCNNSSTNNLPSQVSSTDIIATVTDLYFGLLYFSKVNVGGVVWLLFLAAAVITPALSHSYYLYFVLLYFSKVIVGGVVWLLFLAAAVITPALITYHHKYPAQLFSPQVTKP